MIIDTGSLKKIACKSSITIFNEKGTTVKEFTIFMDFEKIKGLYVTLERKDAIKLKNEIEELLNV